MRVLACATDAGGAANVAPVVATFSKPERIAFAAESTVRYFEAAGVSEVSLWNSASAESVLDTMGPDAVIAGTTRYSSPDRELTLEGRSRRIPTVVVLDEWYRYADRFRDEEGALRYLPDRICVPNELARREAVAEGLPQASLVVTGSPALAALCDQLEETHRRPPEVPEVLRHAVRPWIVFLSETHAADFGDTTGTPGPLGPSLGYTEVTVANGIVAVLGQLGRACTVVEKLHPAAASASGAGASAPETVAWHVMGRAPLLPLLWHADMVIGMRSVAMLESALAGRPTVSYQPGLEPAHGPATAERLGLVSRANDEDELQSWLTNHWEAVAPVLLPRPDFAMSGAAERIHSVVRELVADARRREALA